jgi:hypothetical protein
VRIAGTGESSGNSRWRLWFGGADASENPSGGVSAETCSIPERSLAESNGQGCPQAEIPVAHWSGWILQANRGRTRRCQIASTP